MATLHVRNVPDRLWERIRSLASAERRSLSAQVITMLERALRAERSRATHAKVLAEIFRDRYECPSGKEIPDSVTLLREDRAR